MIRGVVFDLDHTLFDRYATLRRVLPVMYEKLRGSIPADMSCDAFIDCVINGDRAAIHRGWEYVVAMLTERGVFLPGTQAQEVIDCLFNDCWPCAAVKYSFTDTVLEKLRTDGYRLGIITNGFPVHQMRKIAMLGIERYFDKIIICGSLPRQKPDALPFEEMSRELNIPPQQLMYVGDNPKNDVDGSRRAGYTPVWVRTTGSWIFDEIEHCEYEIDTIEQLPALLCSINGSK